MAGIVSAMALSCDGTLAAGTFSRGVGLYDSQGMGDAIGTWSLMGDGEDGSGVTSLHWSMCGRYLVVAERGSDGLGVWDIRGTGRRLAWLVGRKARTMQRLGVALGSNLIEDGGNVYAGGTDGYVRLWKGIGVREGTIDSDWQWMAHDDVISGLGVHACGSVVATCSGSRRDVITDQHDLEEDSGGDSGFDDQSKEDKKAKDNSIRVWSLEPRASSQDDS